VDIYASDEEKGEDIKRWWRENGLSVIVGLALGIAVLVGGRYWLSQEQMQSASASALYQQTQQFIAAGKTAEAESSVDQLFSTYSTTPYAVFAAFEMAKHTVQNGNTDNAKPYFNWVINHGKLKGQVDIARLRLGQLLLDQGDAGQALVLAKQAETIAFKSLFNELIGDIYIAQDELSEAAKAYRTALSLLEQNEPRSLVLKLKLDDVAGF
jgi:predicted negative regulator of RcsB-dependent stress response